MQKYTILIISILLAVGCYKDTDFTEDVLIVKEPRIIVSGALVGNYLSADGNSNVQFSLLINDNLYNGSENNIPLISLENIVKKGHLIEFFEDGRRTGAAQIPFIENEINYASLTGTEPFQEVEFKNELELNNDLFISFVNAKFIDEQSTEVSENLTLNYHYTEDSDYLSHLIRYTYGEEGSIEVVDAKSSFYLGVEKGNNALALNQGEIEITYSGEMNQSLFYFNREEKSWEWVSDFTGDVNTDKITRTGWYVIGESKAARLIKGQVKGDDLAIVNQRVNFINDEYTTVARTSSSGRFECFVPEIGDNNLELLNSYGQVVIEQKYDSKEDVIQVNLSETVLNSNYLKSDFKVLDCDGVEEEFKNINIKYNDGKSDVIYLENEADKWIPVESSNFEISSGNGPIIDWSKDKGEIHYLSNCSSMQNGFTYVKIRSDQKIYPAFREDKLGEKTYLEDDVSRLKLIIETSSKGNITSEKINISINDASFGESGYFVSCELAESGCGIELCEITHYKEDGDEWNRVYFKGEVWMQTINPAQAGSFDVEGYILSKR